MADIAPFKYRAFLSYSHRDKAWGEWLHRALEHHRIDKDLIGRDTPAGPVPKTLRPIFRDREDFSAGHSLAAQTIAALEASQFLIVVCSPDAAKSAYVNEEIRRFKALGRGERIIPVIVAGDPGLSDDDCFPPALRFKLNPAGALTDEREEPIAADARPQGDGKDLARQKIVAGLLGLGLDEIVRRGARAQRRRNRIWASIAGIFLLLAVAATGSAVYAWQQLKTNEAFLDATLDRFTSIVNRAVERGAVLFAAAARHSRIPGGGRGHAERDGAIRPADAAAAAAPDRHADRIRRQLSRPRAHSGRRMADRRGAAPRRPSLRATTRPTRHGAGSRRARISAAAMWRWRRAILRQRCGSSVRSRRSWSA